jgi:hypothetical protein
MGWQPWAGLPKFDWECDEVLPELAAPHADIREDGRKRNCGRDYSLTFSSLAPSGLGPTYRGAD